MASRIACMALLIVLSVESSAHDDTALLSWSTPTQRENGTPLALHEIKSYTIRFWQAGLMPKTMIINDPLINKIQLFNLRAGQHFFTIHATSVDGFVGRESRPVSKLVGSIQ